jgi:hypothetical protein
MVAGLSGAALEYVLYRLGVLKFTSPMASNIWTAVWGLVAGLAVTVVLSFLTEAPQAQKLKGLVYSGAIKEKDPAPWYRTPGFYAIVVLSVFIALNVKFF